MRTLDRKREIADSKKKDEHNNNDNEIDKL